MKRIALFEEFNELDKDIAQSLETKAKMIKDYKSFVGQLKSIYMNDKNADPDAMAKNIMSKSNVVRGSVKIPNTYLLKYAQIIKSERRAREIENSIKDGQDRINDLKSTTDKTLAAQNATQVSQIQNDTKRSTDELIALKSKVNKDYQDFDKYMKTEIETTKKELLNTNK